MNKNLKIEYVPIETIKAYERNAKLHPQEQIQQIKNSILEFGFNDPIAVWKDNEIIEGHGRLIAAKELGLTEIPIIRLDDLTDQQRSRTSAQLMLWNTIPSMLMSLLTGGKNLQEKRRLN